MDRNTLQTLLERVQRGDLSVADALERLSSFPGAELDDAHLDTQRLARTGDAEMVFGAGKTAEQVANILAHLCDQGQPGLVTRVDSAKAEAVRARLGPVHYWPDARVLYLRPDAPGQPPPEPTMMGRVAVVSAGTSDLSVAEEAAVVAEALGNPVDRFRDVGVAGLHRILGKLDALRLARVAIVVAGMEGALPSVVAGLVAAPVIAVPTSVGYGASFGGLAALLAMLNSCAPGVSVVNIDNGYGAAVQASRINRLGEVQP